MSSYTNSKLRIAVASLALLLMVAFAVAHGAPAAKHPKGALIIDKLELLNPSDPVDLVMGVEPEDTTFEGVADVVRLAPEGAKVSALNASRPNLAQEFLSHLQRTGRINEPVQTLELHFVTKAANLAGSGGDGGPHYGYIDDQMVAVVKYVQPARRPEAYCVRCTNMVDDAKNLQVFNNTELLASYTPPVTTSSSTPPIQ